jgi:hypothetical protein
MSGIVGQNPNRGSGVIGATAIADESVDSDAYVDASIDNAHLADDAVDSDELATGAVDNDHMAVNSIDSDQYVDASIDTAHIATNQIDETLMKDAFVADFTEVTVATGDSLIFGDATASGNTKRDTVQGVIDLVHGATVGVQTIWVPAAAMRPTDDANCEAITSAPTQAGRPDMVVLDFKVAADSFAQFQVAFPKSWNEGVIKFQAFWCSTATDTDAVDWQLEGVSVPDNSTIDVAYGTAVHVTDNNQSAAEEMLVSPLSADLTIASAAVDTVTFFRIGRDVSAGTAAEDARLLGVKLFFTTDAENDA